MERIYHESSMYIKEIYPEKNDKANFIIETPENLQSIIDKVSSILDGWDIKDTRIIITNKEVDFYIELFIADRYLSAIDKFIPMLQLYSLYLPLNYRRMKLGTSLLNVIEELAKKHNLPLLVGPVIEENMHLLLESRNKYKRRHIFDYLLM